MKNFIKNLQDVVSHLVVVTTVVFGFGVMIYFMGTNSDRYVADPYKVSAESSVENEEVVIVEFEIGDLIDDKWSFEEKSGEKEEWERDEILKRPPYEVIRKSKTGYQILLRLPSMVFKNTLSVDDSHRYVKVGDTENGIFPKYRELYLEGN